MQFHVSPCLVSPELYAIHECHHITVVTLSAGAAQPAASRGTPAAAHDDSRMQDMILSEVLDSSSGVRWSDIAGLATAKQVISNPPFSPTVPLEERHADIRSDHRGLILLYVMHVWRGGRWTLRRPCTRW